MFRRFSFRRLLMLAPCVAGGLLAQSPAPPAPPAPAVHVNAAVVERAVQDGERVWRSVLAEPTPGLASRDLFTYALALCESKANPERLERLFVVATQMQQRDPQTRGYGNFRWSWRDADVFDFNAVDFCLQAGAILWLRHRETMPPAARALLKPLIDHGVEGLLKHRVNESYTNIALMNAGNLLLLGEATGRREVAAEGGARLDRIVLYMAEAGVHEYVSPTYYGVDLDDVMLIEAFSTNERARTQARAVRDLLWTDIALNWFPASGKLAGARSRDYDYLRGLGYLDEQLQANGWINRADGGVSRVIFLAYLPASVAPAIQQLSEKFPRLVTQTWGVDRGQTRTHYLCADVTLSSAAAGYGGRMDLPLTVDLPGPREGIRGYFIPDGRGDPYGRIKIQESQAHAKTLHLRPFWTAAQRTVDAVGLAIYRPDDVPAETRTLASHFVLPLDVDEIWVGGKLIHFTRDRATSYPLNRGEAVVVRKGSALVGLRVPWSRQVTGTDASAALGCDAANFGAMRLTVAHHVDGKALPAKEFPGAAWWVRIGSEVKTADAVEKWRRAFEVAHVEVEARPERIAIRVPGRDGPVAVSVRAPFQTLETVEPRVPRQILACNGEDLGAALLRGIEPVRSLRSRVPPGGVIGVPARGAVAWEAESGVLVPPMTPGNDAGAGNGYFVWMPAQPGERAGSSVGRARYELSVASAGPRYIWGRVLTATPENDSFFVALSTEEKVILEQTSWPTSVHKEWTWVRFTPEGKGPSPVMLPKGAVTFEVRVREAGAKLDRIFVTTDPQEQPH